MYKYLHKHLRPNGRRQKRKNAKDNRVAITGRVGIKDRPKVVKQR